MEKLIHKLQRDYPGLIFSSNLSLCWSPGSNEISYPKANSDASVLAGLLHEVGHARLGHTGYVNDLELLQKEIAAWQEALKLGKAYKVMISKEYIEDCLDTYRDWVYKRSICPVCAAAGLQKDETQYTCFNCGHYWHVSSSHICRPYRRSK